MVRFDWLCFSMHCPSRSSGKPCADVETTTNVLIDFVRHAFESRWEGGRERGREEESTLCELGTETATLKKQPCNSTTLPKNFSCHASPTGNHKPGLTLAPVIPDVVKNEAQRPETTTARLTKSPRVEFLESREGIGWLVLRVVLTLYSFIILTGLYYRLTPDSLKSRPAHRSREMLPSQS